MKKRMEPRKVLDRFGKGIPIRPAEQEGWSETAVEVALSDQFLGWIFSLGTSVRILGPAEVVERFTAETQALTDFYRKKEEDKK